MLKGTSKLKQTNDTRKPITIDILQTLVKSLKQSNFNKYAQKLYKAMLLIAFYALLRIGEFTVKQKNPLHTLNLQDISIENNKSDTYTLQILMRHFKHSKNPVTFRLDNLSQAKFCPVKSLIKYLNKRPQSNHPQLFINEKGSPISTLQFSKVFKQLISLNGLDTSVYKPHSLRIGGGGGGYLGTRT